MTLEEVCSKLKISESSVKTNFARTQKKFIKERYCINQKKTRKRYLL